MFSASNHHFHSACEGYSVWDHTLSFLSTWPDFTALLSTLSILIYASLRYCTLLYFTSYTLLHSTPPRGLKTSELLLYFNTGSQHEDFWVGFVLLESTWFLSTSFFSTSLYHTLLSRTFFDPTLQYYILLCFIYKSLLYFSLFNFTLFYSILNLFYFTLLMDLFTILLQMSQMFQGSKWILLIPMHSCLPSPYGMGHSWSPRPDWCVFWFPNMITTQIRKKKKKSAHLRMSEKIGFPHVCFYKHSIPLISSSILLFWLGPPPDRPICRPRHALRLLAGKRQGKGRIQ